MSQSDSFIPKQVTPRPTKVRRRRVYVVSYLTYTLFIGVLIVVAGMLVWEWRLDSQLANQQQNLYEERTRFQQSDIARVNELDHMIDTVAYLLDRQPAVTKLLTALEETTVQGVQLTDFSLALDEAEPDNLLVTYQGKTSSFDVVLAQRTAMKNNDVLDSATITGLAYGDQEEAALAADTTGRITYDVSLVLPIEAIMYRGEAAAAAPAQQPATPDPATADETSSTTTDSSTADTEAVDTNANDT